MKTNSNSSESKTDSAPDFLTPAEETTINDTTDVDGEEGLEDPEASLGDEEPEDDAHDEFGYDVEKTEDDETEETPEEVEETEEKKEEKKSSGYGDEPEEVEETEEKKEEKEKTPEELTAEEALDKELTEAIKDIGEGYDQDKIKAFAKEHKLTSAQLKAYKDLVKVQDAEAVKENERLLKEQRSTWHKELKEDKEFGGANFVKNVDRVEKLIENHMPNVKKLLDEKKGMLPPSFMRDLLSLAKAINPKAKFVSGSAPAPKSKSTSDLESLYPGY